MVDFTRYNPPGVYVEDATSPLVSPTGVPQSIVCLTGPAVGYQTYTETVTVGIDSPGTVLTQPGIFSEQNVGSGISNLTAALPDGTALTYGNQSPSAAGDYSLDYDSTTTATTIRLVASGPNVGSATSLVLTVTYNYMTSEYHDVQVFTDYDSVVEFYGQPLMTTPPLSATTDQIISPLSLAAKIAFENGANELLMVGFDPTKGSTSNQAGDAYSKILAIENVSIVVPIITDAGLDASEYLAFAQALDQHCVQASMEGNPRIGVIGLPGDLADPQADAKTIAAGVASARLVLAYPDLLFVYNGFINQTATVAGIYLAAAYAGLLSKSPVQDALTKQIVRSFTGLPASVQRVMTKSNKDSLSKSGVAVAEIDRQSRFSIRHGVATDMSSVLTREVSITRARDALMLLLQTGLDNAGLIGSPITTDTPIIVQAAVTGILENAKSTGVLVDYSSLSVRQQALPSGDPTIIEVKFAYKPAFPLNYVVVSFSIDLSTGTNTLAALTTP